MNYGLSLDWVFSVLNATLNNISAIYRGGKFYWCRKPEYPGENHRPAASQ